MIRVLLLDLDGTLIDRVALWRRCLTSFCAERGLPHPPQYWIDMLLVHPTAFDWQRMGVAIKARYPDLGMSQAAVGFALRGHLLRSAVPDPAVNAVLDDLACRYRLAMVTNGSARLQRAKIVGAGLDGRFGAEFISGRMGVRKPDPEFFRRVLAWAEVEPSEVLIVGDSPREDMMGGRRAGLRTCFVGRASNGWGTDPDYQVARFTDLPGVLG